MQSVGYLLAWDSSVFNQQDDVIYIVGRWFNNWEIKYNIIYSNSFDFDYSISILIRKKKFT